jgi:hypothetical protein
VGGTVSVLVDDRVSAWLAVLSPAFTVRFGGLRHPRIVVTSGDVVDEDVITRSVRRSARRHDQPTSLKSGQDDAVEPNALMVGHQMAAGDQAQDPCGARGFDEDMNTSSPRTAITSPERAATASAAKAAKRVASRSASASPPRA